MTAPGRAEWAHLPDVPIEHLDYAYVEKCSDLRELKDILTVLESGKEGKYPELERTTEERMLEVMSPAERKRYIVLKSEPTPVEEDEAVDDVAAWLAEITEADASLRESNQASSRSTTRVSSNTKEIFGSLDGSDASSSSKSSHTRRKLPPVRGSGGNSASSGGAATAEESVASGPWKSKKKNKKSVKAASAVAQPKRRKEDPRKKSFKEYYNSWDDYDPDVAVDEMEKREAAEAAKSVDIHKAREEKRKAAPSDGEDWSSMSHTERTFHARREKEKGNECVRAGEFDDAVICYTRSLRILPDNAIVLANRAMAYLRLKDFRKAEADCTKSMRLDPCYMKAVSRRAMARHRMGKYLEAIEDYETALRHDPHNTKLRELMMNSRRKYEEVEGDAGVAALRKRDRGKTSRGFTRISIVESDDDDSNDAGGAPSGLSGGFTRISIVESDDDDDEEDEDGEDVAINSTSGGMTGSDFSAASSFLGARHGYVFKHGSKGLGYYADASASVPIAHSSGPVAASPPPPPVAEPTHDSEPVAPKTESMRLKDAGNEKFKAGDMEGAVKLYTSRLVSAATRSVQSFGR